RTSHCWSEPTNGGFPPPASSTRSTRTSRKRWQLRDGVLLDPKMLDPVRVQFFFAARSAPTPSFRSIAPAPSTNWRTNLKKFHAWLNQDCTRTYEGSPPGDLAFGHTTGERIWGRTTKANKQLNTRKKPT